MASQLDLELPSQDIVKCVVVGDTGIGKTRLICARACGTRSSLHQLVQNHVSTVWAIDHYRRNREVVDRSWCFIDGVNVSLRLWDTFGYHDKDRRFAYGRADVIVLCFSVGKPKSLRNVTSVWVPEIRRFCPGVPIILCGCQVDLRHLVINKEFKNMEKGVFYKEILEDDILTPDKGREVAKQFGAHYYETSVLEWFGITELFENAVRASLIRKRSQHFWNVLGHLKNISRPSIQAPYLPPKPPTPKVLVPEPSMSSDMEKLLNQPDFSDVIFCVKGVTIPAHKFILISSSSVFEKIFSEDIKKGLFQPPPDIYIKNGGSTKGKAHTFPRSKSKECCACGANSDKSMEDTANLLDNQELQSIQVESIPEKNPKPKDGPPIAPVVPPPIHPAVVSITERTVNDPDNLMEKTQTVVTLSPMVPPKAFQCVLHYLYTGQCLEMVDVLADVGRVAELFCLYDLVQMAKNLQKGEMYVNKAIQDKVLAERMHRVRDLLLRKGILSDIVFQLDDGCVSAHKAILSARSDYMVAMFNYGFRECSEKIISFPGVSKDEFLTLLEYLYTSDIPKYVNCDRLELIQLANQLCLPRLIVLVERNYVAVFETAMEHKKDVMEEVSNLLELAQLHNASQLAAWCAHFICTNYSCIYRKHSKIIYKLSPENQRYVQRHRYPPVWYLQELDIYEKHVIDWEREKMIKGIKFRRASVEDCSGCLGFCSRRNNNQLMWSGSL